MIGMKKMIMIADDVVGHTVAVQGGPLNLVSACCSLLHVFLHFAYYFVFVNCYVLLFVNVC